MIPGSGVPPGAAVGQDCRGCVPVVKAPEVPTIARVHQEGIQAASGVCVTENDAHIAIGTRLQRLDVNLKLEVAINPAPVLHPAPCGGGVRLCQFAIADTPRAAVDQPAAEIAIVEVVRHRSKGRRCPVRPVDRISFDAHVVCARPRVVATRPQPE